MGRQKYVLLLLLCFAFLELIHHVIGMSRRNERNCVVTNAKNEHWRLKWEESFDGDLEGWKWHQGMKALTSTSPRFIIESPSLKENGFIYESNLVLVAKHSLGDPINPYAGAILTSPVLHPQNFTSANVRYEIRAALPLGTQIMSSISAQAESLEPKPACEYNWLEPVTNAQRPVIQATTLCETIGLAEFKRQKKEHKELDFNRYQTYGIHWNATHVNLLVNENSTLEVPLNDNPPQISDPRRYQLIFMVALGGRYFYQPFPNDFAAHKWPCPAMIVDYIRVYEKVELAENIPQCELQDEAKDDVLDGICQMALKLSVPKSNSGSNISLILVLISTLLLTALLFFGYLKRSGILNISKSTRKAEEEPRVIYSSAVVNEVNK